MSIAGIVSERKINEILHFTTNNGLTGILDTESVKPRRRLSQDKRLEFIRQYNCPDRSRDEIWHDYVNLSITTVNLRLFDISKDKWHSPGEYWWCILSFSPSLLEHEGVYFATTNNIYTDVRREKGDKGLENLFADTVVRWTGNVAIRQPYTSAAQPTCNQAEVLYPGELPIKYLERVYVEDDIAASSVESMCDLFNGLPEFECIVSPELFK